MSLTIVLSGPKAVEQQARRTLAALGFAVEPAAPGHGHGLPENEHGDQEQEPHSFIHVLGDDVDRAHQAVQAIGWRLRMHYETPEPAPPSWEEVLARDVADLKRELRELKERL